MTDAPLDALVIGCSYHDFETNGPLIADALRERGTGATVTTDKSELRPDGVAARDVVVDYMTDSTMTEDQRAGFLGFVRDGGGYVGVHCAADVKNFHDGPGNDPELEALLGGGYDWHPEKCDVTVEFVDRDHPVTDGLDDFTVFDEPYHFGAVDGHLLATTTHEEMGEVPVAWTRRYGDGRVCYVSVGHTNEACRHPTFRDLVARAVAWTVRA